jgi:hypothetical protein
MDSIYHNSFLVVWETKLLCCCSFSLREATDASWKGKNTLLRLATVHLLFNHSQIAIHDLCSEVFHYVNDFIVLGCSGTEECVNNMGTNINAMEELGVPKEPEGLNTYLPFLRIEISTIQLKV